MDGERPYVGVLSSQERGKLRLRLRFRLVLIRLCVLQDLLEYKKKLRTLKVRMLDGTVKMLMVDDSQPVGQMMIVICTKIGTCLLQSCKLCTRRASMIAVGITNYEEYSMVRELSIKETDPYRSTSTLPKKEEKSGFGTLTLGRSKEKKMEQLRAKLHTDEERRSICDN